LGRRGPKNAKKRRQRRLSTTGSEEDAPNAACIPAYDVSDLDLLHGQNKTDSNMLFVCSVAATFEESFGYSVGSNKLTPCLLRM
jgi:hypothetical protein